MQRWEYMRWIVARVGGFGDSKVQARDVAPIADWENGPSLNEALEQAGDEGWELVSCQVRRWGVRHLQDPHTLEVAEHHIKMIDEYVFKRPKP